MTKYLAMRELPDLASYKKNDVLVLFGELFQRGYANGLVEAAERRGLKIVRSTVGRRDSDGKLRALTIEEAQAVPKPFINIPLEAGFDMEPASNGTTPCEALAGVKIKEWDLVKLNWQQIAESRKSAILHFRKNSEQFMSELAPHIPAGANVLFVHTMAGGVPRAKILMPTMNRVFKGKGERFLSSELFWQSDLGKLCEQNFIDVTGETLRHLIEASDTLRAQIEKSGGRARYVAYGYHGTEVLMDGHYRWQSYSPYVQGWAKVHLENVASQFHRQGVHTTVFNCPEILTNSSSIFQGVEVCLYPLMGALRKEGASAQWVQQRLAQLQDKLKSAHSVDEVLQKTDRYLLNPVIQNSSALATWPQHNTQPQMELMLNSSDELIEMHKDEKELMTFALSQDVFTATGELMFNDSWQATQPVWWLNHDIVAKQLIALNA